MNFYEHQDRAQKRTKIIVFLFIIAVILIIAVVEIPVGIATNWDPYAVGAAALFCVLIVGVSTLVKLGQLRGGGQVVAEMLGGTLIQPHGSDQAEQRIRNIVEEMAIASGMPVPPVYVIEDASINAFAAGWSPSDAVVGVTRGCIEQLNRDELQGVVAHEFSHISHGDMRLNIRLIGVIFGIMALGITGWIMVRFIGPALLHSTSRSRSKEGAGGAGIALGIIVFGLFLAMCGAIGTLFGRLIQAAVSRQREFLADASAVQYTRNPQGIGGALRKIGGISEVSTMPHSSGQCNHMFFSQAVSALFASHPSMDERIARIEGIDVSSLTETAAEGISKKGSSGVSSVSDASRVAGISGISKDSGALGISKDSGAQVVSGISGGASRDSGVSVGVEGVSRASGISWASHFSSTNVRDSIDSAGEHRSERLHLAKGALDTIDSNIRCALYYSWSARLVMFALLVDEAQLQRQQSILAKSLSEKELNQVNILLPLVQKVKPTLRLSLIDIAAPALQQLSVSQRKEFDQILSSLIQSDGVVDRFEWVFVSVLRKHFTGTYGKPGSKRAKSTLASLSGSASIVLGALAYCGATQPEQANEAYVDGMSVAKISVPIPSMDDCTMGNIDRALEQLQSLTFLQRKLLLDACGACVTHDNKVTVEEAETIRAIGDVLDCPIPMFG